MSIFVNIRNKNEDVLQMSRELNSDEEVDELIKSEKVPVMVIYYASWCPHCQAMEGTWNELAKKTEGKAKVVKIESEKTKKVGAFPTAKIAKKGKIVKTVEGGGQSADDLEKMLLGGNGGLRRRRTGRLRSRVRKTHRARRLNVTLR